MLTMMKPIRILQIMSIMNRGGAETLVMNIYRHIDRSRVQFDFLLNYTDPGAFDEEIRQLGGNIYYMPHIRKVGYRGFQNHVTHFLREHPYYQVVHCHRNELSGFILKAARQAGVPVRMAHSHSSPKYKYSLKGFPELLLKQCAKRQIGANATHLFACSEEAGISVFGNKAQEKFSIIRNGIDLSLFIQDDLVRSAIRNELGLDGKWVIGHVGSMKMEKNHSLILDIFASIHREHRNSVLMLVGDGVLRESIEAKVSMLGLEEVVYFLGARGDVHILMQAMDVFLFPSLYEGLGIVLVEAQALGIPCVVSNTVPREVDMGLQLLDFVDLEASTAYWSDRVLATTSQALTFNSVDSINIQDKLRDNGYDITDIATTQEQFYTQVYDISDEV